LMKNCKQKKFCAGME